MRMGCSSIQRMLREGLSNKVSFGQRLEENEMKHQHSRVSGGNGHGHREEPVQRPWGGRILARRPGWREHGPQEKSSR